MFQDFRLKVFYTCALKGSFSKAAEVLGISQPAVSKHISELEKDISDLLFERRKGKVVLTPKGKILYKYAKQLIGIYDCANRELVPIKNEEFTQLRIGAVADAFKGLLPPLIAHFENIYPNIKTTLIERNPEELENLIEDELIDIGITTDSISKEEISLFATLSVTGSATPIAKYFLIKKRKKKSDGTIEKFINSCRTF